MILEWKNKNVHVVPLLANDKITPLRSEVILLEGNNEVSDDEYTLMKPHLKLYLDAGQLVEVTEKVPAGPGKPAKTAQNLADFPTKKAITIVQNTVNPHTLQFWNNKETRPEVRLAVAKQMEKLEVQADESVTGDDLVIDDTQE